MACIYVIGGATGPLKVGIANDPESRRTTLQRSSPEPLTVLYSGQASSRQAAYQIETRAHRILRAHHNHAEWFNVSQQMAIDAIVLASFELEIQLLHLVDPRSRSRFTRPGDRDAKRADSWARSLTARRYARQRALAARD